MKVIVTGGAGFIGSALVRYLINTIGAEVLNIDKLTYAGNLSSLKSIALNPKYKFLKADICDFSTIRNSFFEFSPDIIFNLAAETHVDRSIDGAADFIQTNIVGTYNLIEIAKNYWQGLQGEKKDNFRFLHISTDEVFGSLGAEGIFTETTAYDPSSPYSASKAASDFLVKSWHKTYGFPALISNCSNNYGPFHFPEKLIPLTIINGIRNLSINVYGNGKNVRDWLYVDDHVAALYLIATKGKIGETYNVGARSEKTNIEVVSKICDLLDEKMPKDFKHSDLIKFVIDRPGHDLRYAIDPSKIEDELGFCASMEFEKGLAATIDWYIENQDWWAPLGVTYDGARLGKL